MKKLLSLLLALALALSCAGAVAEEALPLETKTTVAVNAETMTALLGGALGTDDAQLPQLLVSLISALGVHSVAAETGTQTEMTLKDTPVLTFSCAPAEEGLALVSDLFPSYAIVVPQETLAQFSGLDEEALAPYITALTAHIQNFSAAAMAKAGAPEQGEFTFGEVTFNTKVPVEMTLGELAQLERELLKALAADETLGPVLASVEGFDLEALSQTLTPSEEDAAAPVQAAVYLNMDAEGNADENVYATVRIVTSSTSVALDASVVAGSVYCNLLMGDPAYATAEALAEAAGSTSDAMQLALSIIPGESENMQMELWLVTAGTPMGAVFATAAAEAGLTETVSLYLGDASSPLLTLTGVTVPGGEIAPVSLEGKTLVTLEQLTNDEEGTLVQGLVMDVMGYGLNNLIANAAAVMPDEVSALVELLAPAEDTAEAE